MFTWQERAGLATRGWEEVGASANGGGRNGRLGAAGPAVSPPRRQARHDSPDQSPPRRGQRHDSPDPSRPQKRERHGSPDQSPPRRRQRHDSPDQSPPRRGALPESPDQSPPRRHQRHDSPDQSPPRRRQRHDSPDQSPPRRGGRPDSPDQLPPQRPAPANGAARADLSPPRRAGGGEAGHGTLHSLSRPCGNAEHLCCVVLAQLSCTWQAEQSSGIRAPQLTHMHSWRGAHELRVYIDDAYCSVSPVHVALSLLRMISAHDGEQQTHGVERWTWDAACRAEPRGRAGAAAGAAPGQAAARAKRMSDGSIAGLVAGRDLVQEAQRKRKVPRPPDRPDPDVGPRPVRETMLGSARRAAGPRSPMRAPLSCCRLHGAARSASFGHNKSAMLRLVRLVFGVWYTIDRWVVPPGRGCEQCPGVAAGA
jgi:hypothetical protein